MTVTFCGHGDLSYSNDIKKILYDETIYPDIEHIPKRLAIIKRNEYMADAADVVVAYVDHDWGGAAKMLKYAKKRVKRVRNIPEL